MTHSVIFRIVHAFFVQFSGFSAMNSLDCCCLILWMHSLQFCDLNGHLVRDCSTIIGQGAAHPIVAKAKNVSEI